MKTIHKFGLLAQRETVLMLPDKAQIIRFAMQNDIPHVWALVESQNTFIRRCFTIVGTGWSIPDGWQYIGTCVDDGGFVWHLLEYRE